MRRVVTAYIALASLLLVACVTINVYFPAAAADQAADRITKDILGTGGANTTPRDPKKTSSLAPSAPARLLATVGGAVLNFIVPAAHAQAAPDLDVSSPEVKAIQASMKSRNAALAPYYTSGAVGFSDNGDVEVRDQNLVPLPERGNVRKLVADENKDRAAFYAEIAKSNGHPEWANDIRSAFAKRWVANAPAGSYYKEGGAWKQK